MDALTERLFGRTISRENPLAAPVVPSVAASHVPEPSEVARLPLRKRSPLEALQIQDARTESQQPQPLHRPPKINAPAGSLTRQAQQKPSRRKGEPMGEYKGYLISTSQGPDGRWSASYVQLGSGQAEGPVQKCVSNSYLGRFLAVADAELEIDDLTRRQGY